MEFIRHAWKMAFLALLSACNGDSRTILQLESSQGDDFEWGIPSKFPLPIVPKGNPMSEAKFQLGRHLFYDTRISGNGTQSCASCHHQDKAFSDGRALPIGSTGEVHHRSSMPLANIAYVPTLTWANPSLRELEQQILVPLFGEHPIEQGINDSNWPVVQQRLRDEPLYEDLFQKASPQETTLYTKQQIVDALAVFVRGLISFDSPYDRFQQGDADALSASALRGQNLFFGEVLECSHCHGSYNLTDSNADRSMNVIERPFHNTGLFNIGGRGDFPGDNQGIFSITEKESDMGKFRAVSLRNIELTAPYMHDGSIASLSEVIDFYAAGGRNIPEGIHAGDGRKSPFKDGFVTGFSIDQSQKNDLIEFLKSLTDRAFVSNERFSNPWPQP